MMEDLGGTSDDLEGLINFPLTVKDIEAVAFFKEVGDQDWRVSMRSKGNVDTGAIARQFSGGGHTNAAGCSAKGALDDGLQAIRTVAGGSNSQQDPKSAIDPRSAINPKSEIRNPRSSKASSSSTRPRGRPRTTSSSLRDARSASRASDTPARSIRWRPACCRWYRAGDAAGAVPHRQRQDLRSDDRVRADDQYMRRHWNRRSRRPIGVRPTGSSPPRSRGFAAPTSRRRRRIPRRTSTANAPTISPAKRGPAMAHRGRKP